MPAQLEWGLEAYVEGRFPGVHPRDTDAIERYHAQLETARRRAERSPLAWGQSYSLALTAPQPNPRPNSRRVPSVPNLPRISLRLNKPLQTGVGKMSQVWTAVEEKTGTTLVLKIIQPSMCPYPKVDRCWSGYMEPADLAHREVWGYERLALKQGLLVPYFFGLDTVRSNFFFLHGSCTVLVI
ncbi:hypothetical protein GGX14DRAFT_441150 [Mycena pura]|uniref:Uncharacterized protein n=1 Tax=Mycena pura TaxID=153505 RepID=A0AAD6VML7_9AGAR|nr:hypothetical protein GGX14DRAFT_441150 [Mycena pura]